MAGREQGKPIFGFLWPEKGLVSTDQEKYVRIGKRGLLRLVVLVAQTLFLTFLSVTSLTFLINTNITILEILVISLVVATISVFVFRAWTLGTYVNDHAVKIVTLLRTHVVDWSAVRDISCEKSKWRLVGIPLLLNTRRVLIRVNSGDSIATHLYLGSIDGIFTTTQLDVHHSMIVRWFRAE